MESRGTWKPSAPRLPGAVATNAIMVGGALAALIVAAVATNAIAVQPGAPAPCRDADRDGYGEGCALGPDCDDRDAARHPGAEERCNLVDDDCDFIVDDGCLAPAVDDRARVAVAMGPFVMGSDPGEGSRDERPEHLVALAGFSLDAHEVTIGRYEDCVRDGGCAAPEPGGSRFREIYFGDPRFARYPVVNVDWYQADVFCRWAGGRLPTEAEWEKAARGAAPSERVYPWGDEPPRCDLANFGGVAGCVGDTDRVGARPAGKSPFGAFDMAGNVWEWTADWYDSQYYASSPATDPTGPQWGSFKVIRGGCFEQGPANLRTSCRASTLPSTRSPNVGFRCAWGGP